MQKFEVQLEQIQTLIDWIQTRSPYQRQSNRYDCEKLLKLSQQVDYSYGQALARVHLARYYGMGSDDDSYQFFIAGARIMAENKNYPDVLAECFRQEGLHALDHGDENGALSSFLKGIQSATDLGDNRLCGALYNNIGEIFFGLKAYEDAEKFYKRALQTLEAHSVRSNELYREVVLLNMTRLACARGDVPEARRCLGECHTAPREGGYLTLLFCEWEAQVLLLEAERAQALEKATALLTAIERSEEDTAVLQPLYLSLADLLLRLESREVAARCLDRIDALYGNAKRHVAILICALHVRYAEQFHTADGVPLERFYRAVQEGEQAGRAATGESFKNLILLHEAEVEQRRMVEAQTHLRLASERDELTKLYNRRYHSKLMSKLIQDERVSTLGYMMVDVDYFKGYNDHYGHQKGDRILQLIASLLEKNLPEGAYAARYGGDEFSCLFVDKREEEIVAFIRAVQSALAENAVEHKYGGPTGTLTLSFGVYNAARACVHDEFTMIGNADKALYQAKNAGRNTYSVIHDGGKQDGV